MYLIYICNYENEWCYLIKSFLHSSIVVSILHNLNHWTFLQYFIELFQITKVNNICTIPTSVISKYSCYKSTKFNTLSSMPFGAIRSIGGSLVIVIGTPFAGIIWELFLSWRLNKTKQISNSALLSLANKIMILCNSLIALIALWI